MRPCLGIGADKINQFWEKKALKNIKGYSITFSMIRK